MNRVTKIQNLNKINERELDLGVTGNSNKTWHQKYADSAWIYIGGLPYELNEGDILSVFSQYGEIVNINLIRDQKTGKSKGFAFLCYQDQRSTILAVDNFNGIKLLNRLIQVDHCENYKVPKYRESVPEDIRQIWEEGCAPKPINIPEAQLKAEVKAEKHATKEKLEKYKSMVPLAKEDISKELKKVHKAQKKEKKEIKKLKKREKERKKRERMALLMKKGGMQTMKVAGTLKRKSWMTWTKWMMTNSTEPTITSISASTRRFRQHPLTIFGLTLTKLIGVTSRCSSWFANMKSEKRGEAKQLEGGRPLRASTTWSQQIEKPTKEAKNVDILFVCVH